MDLVYDINFIPAGLGSEPDLLDQCPYIIYRVIGCGIEFMNI
jgi:hypothetical protein